jgi:hypothetical protein
MTATTATAQKVNLFIATFFNEQHWVIDDAKITIYFQTTIEKERKITKMLKKMTICNILPRFRRRFAISHPHTSRTMPRLG